MQGPWPWTVHRSHDRGMFAFGRRRRFPGRRHRRARPTGSSLRPGLSRGGARGAWSSMMATPSPFVAGACGNNEGGFHAKRDFADVTERIVISLQAPACMLSGSGTRQSNKVREQSHDAAEDCAAAPLSYLKSGAFVDPLMPPPFLLE